MTTTPQNNPNTPPNDKPGQPKPAEHSTEKSANDTKTAAPAPADKK